MRFFTSSEYIDKNVVYTIIIGFYYMSWCKLVIKNPSMGNDDEVPEDGLVHDEVEIEDFEYDPETDTFTYPCPCGDEFIVSRVSINKFSSLILNRG